MKKKSLFLTLMAAFSQLLSGCSFNDDSISSNSESDTSSSTSDSSSNTDTTTTSSDRPLEGETTIRIFATNDIHGQIYPENETLSDGNGRIGLGKLMTFLKEQKEGHEEVFLLDQGDTWQGGIYSNYNRGKLINDVMNYVKYDARTVGNHDFDWGLAPIKTNTARGYDGYLMPTLAANVYDYNFETKTIGNTQQSDIGKTSTVRTLSNGVKVGIVGVIGQDQITSINSLYTHDIMFKDHVAIAKEEATKLRNQGCNILILSIHGGSGDVLNKGLSDYFDLALCGHTHQVEERIENGMPILQFGEYTTHLGEIELTYNATTNAVTAANAFNAYTSDIIDEAVCEIDPTINRLIEDYKKECDDDGKVVLVNDGFGSFNSSYNAANLMARAIYDTAIDEGYDIDFAYCNNARHELGKSGEHCQWTYADIYQAFPFDNEIVIIEITLDEMVDELLKWNVICKADGTFNVELGHKYKIAVIDYIAFHNDTNREYNYFPSIANYNIDTIDKLSKNYREILKDWLIDNKYDDPEEGKTLDYRDYSTSKTAFNKNEIIMPNVTITFDKNYDGAIERQICEFGRYGSAYSTSYPTTNPTRDDYGFNGWYLEAECTHLADYELIRGPVTLYAKWKSVFIYSSPFFNFAFMIRNGYLNSEVSSGSFDIDCENVNSLAKTFSVNFINAYVEESHSIICLGANGGFVFEAPSGTKISSIHVMQRQYHNIEMYNGTTAESGNRLGIHYDPVTYMNNNCNLYEYTGNSLSTIFVRNSYSQFIRIYFIQVDLILVD